MNFVNRRQYINAVCGQLKNDSQHILGIQIIFQLCLTIFLDSAQVLSADRVFYSYMYVYVFNLDFCVYSKCTWIFTQL